MVFEQDHSQLLPADETMQKLIKSKQLFLNIKCGNNEEIKTQFIKYILLKRKVATMETQRWKHNRIYLQGLL